jgi:hypothetical protein
MPVVQAACSSDTLDLNPVRFSKPMRLSLVRFTRALDFHRRWDTTPRFSRVFRQHSSVEFTSVWLRNWTRLPDVRAVGRTKTLSSN